ncbi:MAG: glycosyltransferase [Anaerolineae bacterium]|nr:glycosyltransferase [Anaerolineae bacterium]
MKIACISTSRVPYSTANSIQVMKVCQALAALGHTVCLWVPGDKPADWESLREFYGLKTPFEVRWLPSQAVWRRYDFSLAVVREAKRWGAELIYTWLLPAALMALWFNLPTLLELHDRVTGHLGPQSYRMFCGHKKSKKRLLVITQALKEKLQIQFKTCPKPSEIQIAPNGVDLDAYENLPNAVEARRLLGLPERVTAVYAGHFYAGRGAELLMSLAERLPQVQFLWVGGSEQAVSEWKERLQKAGINNVVLTGFVPNGRLPMYQAAGEFLLMPYEKFISGSSGGNSVEICSPMKMFDYMAAGRVIISSDLPVIHEVLNPQNAVFCPPGDADAWVRTINDLLENPDKWLALSEKTRQDAAQYSWLERERRALDGF